MSILQPCTLAHCVCLHPSLPTHLQLTWEAIALATLHDRMTNSTSQPIQSFSSGCIPAPLSSQLTYWLRAGSALESQPGARSAGVLKGKAQARSVQCPTTSFSGGWVPRSGPRLLGPGFLHQRRFQELHSATPALWKSSTWLQSNRWGGMGTFWCLRVWRLEDHRDPPWLFLG